MSVYVRTASIVPETSAETVYLVLEDFGRLGQAYVETDVTQADLETIITNLLQAQYCSPVRVAP